MRVQPLTAASAHHHHAHHHHPGAAMNPAAMAAAFVNNPTAALASLAAQSQGQVPQHQGQPGYFIPTMAPHHAQLQQRAYYQSSGGPQGQAPQGGAVRGPRWPQGNQMAPTQGAPQRAQSQYISGNYRGSAPRGGAPSAGLPRSAATAGINARGAVPGAGPTQSAPRPPRGGGGAPPRGATGPGGQSFKYQPNIRNPQQQQAQAFSTPPSAQQPPVPVPQQGIQIQGQEPLTASMLADANPQEQKQMLGERLFPVIHQIYPDMAGKITGMLLEIDNSELLHMLEHHQSLKAKMDEAVAVLQAHQAKETIIQKGSGIN